MWYVITFCVGAFVGFIISAIVTVSSNSNKIQEAYNCGFEDAKNIFKHNV